MVHPASDRISRVPSYLGTLPEEFLFSPTGLSPYLMRLSSRLGLTKTLVTSGLLCKENMKRPTTPVRQGLQTWHPTGLGFSLFARHYWGNLSPPCGGQVDFFSSGYWDVSVHLVGSRTLWIQVRVTACAVRVSPFGNLRINVRRNYPELIAADHVLHRLLAPRHPPCALSFLTDHLAHR